MKQKLLILLFAILLAGCVAKRVIVKFRDGISPTAEMTESFGALKREIPRRNAVVLEVSEDADLSGLRSNNMIEYIEDDVRIGPTQVEGYTDALMGDQWALTALDAAAAWKLHTVNTPTEVIVAICDSGYTFTHEDLPHDAIKGPDYYTGDGDPTDQHSHGTHIAGIIAATANNSLGVAGFAYNIKLWIGKTGDEQAYNGISDIVSCIYDAQDIGAFVINLSTGTNTPLPTIEAAISDVWDAGVMVFASGGNYGSGLFYPAATEKCISVGSIDSNLARSSFSNIGEHQDLVAPGGGILSTMLTGYGYKSGSSMASPYAAAVAALVKSAKPSLTNVEVRALLESTATDLGDPGKDTSYGWGLVNPTLALKHALNQPPVVSPLSHSAPEGTNVDLVISCTGPEEYDECTLTVSELPDFLTSVQVSPTTVEVSGIVPQGEHSFALLAVDLFSGVTDVSFTLSTEMTGTPSDPTAPSGSSPNGNSSPTSMTPDGNPITPSGNAPTTPGPSSNSISAAGKIALGFAASCLIALI